MLEQSDEIGVIDGIENYKSCVHGNRSPVDTDVRRVAVAADIAILLVDSDFMALIQQPGGRHTGYSGPDNGDVFRFLLARIEARAGIRLLMPGLGQGRFQRGEIGLKASNAPLWSVFMAQILQNG